MDNKGQKKRPATIFYHLFRIHHRSSLIVDQKLRTIGITASQFVVLDLLSEFEPASSAELARKIEITPQSMGTFIKDLEYKGLIECEAQTGNKRITLRKRTLKGIDVHKIAINLMIECEKIILGETDKEEVADIRKALLKLYNLSMDL